MTQWLKQSTAATIKAGPFVDDTDGKTAETGLSIAQADIRLSKNGGAFAQSNNSAGGTHDENGYYGIPLDTTDTGTLGRLKLAILKTGALPVFQDFMVVASQVWDSLFGADRLQVDVQEAASSLTPPTAAANADAVWDEALSGHTTSGTAGDTLSDIRTSLDVVDVTVVSTADGDTINLVRGDTASIDIDDLGNLTGYVSLDFTVKQTTDDTDDAAILRVRKNASGLNDGLLRLNGAAGTAAQGSITIDDLAGGDITIAVSAAAMVSVVPITGMVYDVQLITASSVRSLSKGQLNVTPDVLKAVS